MNYLETAMVAAEKFPDRGLYTEKPAETELRWIEALATIAVAQEMRKSRSALEAQTRATVEMGSVIGRILSVRGKIDVTTRADYPSNIPYWDIHEYVSKEVDREMARRESVLWKAMRKFIRGEEEQDDDQGSSDGD